MIVPIVIRDIPDNCNQNQVNEYFIRSYRLYNKFPSYLQII